MTRLSFCITCMGRLHHVRQTLPKNLAWAAGIEGIEFDLCGSVDVEVNRPVRKGVGELEVFDVENSILLKMGIGVFKFIDAPAEKVHCSKALRGISDARAVGDLDRKLVLR